MEVACKEWWYKNKNDRYKLNGYFCLFIPQIVVINYECLENFLLIITHKVGVKHNSP